MVEALQSVTVDAVLLALHEAQCRPGTRRGRGGARALEQVVGSERLWLPLDLHANVTRTMVEHADALVLYRTVPHIDVYETGECAVKMCAHPRQAQPVLVLSKSQW